MFFRNFAEGLTLESDVPQELGAIAAGINHELLQRFGRLGPVRPVFTVLDTTTLPPKKLQEYRMTTGCSYVMIWVPGDEKTERPAINLCRIEVGEQLKLEIGHENGSCETHSIYEFDDPMSLEKLYGSIAEILESLLGLFPSSDNG